MKKNIVISRIKGFCSLLLLCTFAFSLQSCKEDIDDSNFAIAKDKTVTDYLVASDSLSDIKAIFDRVKLGRSDNASSLTAVLSARGNYTVFAPTNSAVKKYVSSLTGSADVSSLTYEQAQLIAFNCIIDNGAESAYETPDFPTSGTFTLSNLNDRLLSCHQDSTQSNSPYVINGTSTVIKENQKVSNGIVHLVNNVISPSANTVAEMIQQAPNMRIMGRLLAETGLADSLAADRDPSYENIEHEEKEPRTTFAVYRDLLIPQKRYLGFTGFVETDDVYAREWGINVTTDSEGTITNWDQVKQAILAKLEPVYGSNNVDDLKNPENPVNRFVAYHFVEGRIPYNKLVIHLSEYGYKYGADMKNPQRLTYSVDVWDYYRTVGKYNDILKVTQVPTGEHEIYLNRVSKYNDDFDGDFSEVSTIAHTPGVGLNVKISATNGQYDNNALNGFYYPIDGILLKTTEVADALGGERMRMDLSTILSEMLSNSIRGADYHFFPKGYFAAITNESSGTKFAYLNAAWAGGTNWTDYQGDEFMAAGLFDFTLRLPPVPKSGTYEIRLGISQNPLRGMAQPYFGDDPYRLQPTGLPLDLRQPVDNNSNPQLNWQDDVADVETNVENDKNLRIQGYMKAPLYFGASDGTGTSKARSLPNGKGSPVVRRIVGIQYMEAGKTYYIRFKSALKKLDSQFFLDYIEYCPSNVYNGSAAENPW